MILSLEVEQASGGVDARGGDFGGAYSQQRKRQGHLRRQGQNLNGKRVFQILSRSSSRFLRTFFVSFSFSQPMTELKVTRTNHIATPKALDAKKPAMSPYAPEIQRTRARSVLMKARRISCMGRPK